MAFNTLGNTSTGPGPRSNLYSGDKFLYSISVKSPLKYLTLTHGKSYFTVVKYLFYIVSQIPSFYLNCLFDFLLIVLSQV